MAVINRIAGFANDLIAWSRPLRRVISPVLPV